MKKFASNHILSLILVLAMASGALGAVMADYTAVPPFLTTSVPPNLLLLIDNSASMYDLAYLDDQKYCYDDTYNNATTYAGYCEPGTWYKYNLGVGQFESVADAAAAAAVWNGAGGTIYKDTSFVGIAIDTTASPDEVTAFAAKGNFLNWAAASKFDIEKKILTGGKFETQGSYGAPNDALVMESRGCVGKRFIKQVAVAAGGSTYYLALGVGGPRKSVFRHGLLAQPIKLTIS
jgi:type IV pilus assembly protein PilY1